MEVTLHTQLGNDDTETVFRLEYSITPKRPATWWEPAEGGIEPDRFWKDDILTDSNQYPEIYDRLIVMAADSPYNHEDDRL